MAGCLEFVKNGQLIDGAFTVTLLGSLNIIKMGNRMKTRKIGNIWKVWFLDCENNIQTAEHKSLQLALSMAFINKTTVLVG
jgi:hypothetical protein